MVLVLLAVGSIIKAEDAYWVGSTGDWFHPANWQYQVPEPEDKAYILNSGTAEIGNGTATTNLLYVGVNQGNSGNINHTGGTLTTGAGHLLLGGLGGPRGAAALRVSPGFRHGARGQRGRLRRDRNALQLCAQRLPIQGG